MNYIVIFWLYLASIISKSLQKSTSSSPNAISCTFRATSLCSGSTSTFMGMCARFLTLWSSCCLCKLHLLKLGVSLLSCSLSPLSQWTSPQFTAFETVSILGFAKRMKVSGIFCIKISPKCIEGFSRADLHGSKWRSPCQGVGIRPASWRLLKQGFTALFFFTWQTRAT